MGPTQQRFEKMITRFQKRRVGAVHCLFEKTTDRRGCAQPTKGDLVDRVTDHEQLCVTEELLPSATSVFKARWKNAARKGRKVAFDCFGKVSFQKTMVTLTGITSEENMHKSAALILRSPETQIEWYMRGTRRFQIRGFQSGEVLTRGF